MYGEISKVVIFAPNQGRTVSGCCREYTMEHGVGCDSRPGKPFSRAGTSPASRGSSRRRGVFCRECCPPRLTWRSAECPVDYGLVLVKVRTTSEGYIHACQGSCSRGSTRSWKHSGASNVRQARTGLEQHWE